MKKFTIALAVLCSSFFAGKAQNLLSKVPNTASVVIKYGGENFSKNLPVKKINTYNFVKDKLFKSLHIDSLTSLENLGINFEKDTYQYVTMEDSTVSFVSLLNLSNVQQFLKLIDSHYHTDVKPAKKNGYEFLSISADTYLGWNDQRAVLVVTSYDNPNKYYSYPSAMDTSATAIDSVVMTTPAPAEDVIKEEVVIEPKAKSHAEKPKQSLGKKKAGPGVNKTGKTVVKKGPAKKKPVKKYEDTEVTTIEEYHQTYQDSLDQIKRDNWYAEEEKVTTAKQLQVADSIISTSFNGNITSIENDVTYKKIIDPSAHMSAWLNYENLLQKYWSVLFKGFYGYRNRQPLKVNNAKNDGFRTAMNVYFEKDKMRIEQKAFSPDEAMAKLGREVMNSKQSTSLVNYVNPDNIGYLSMSMNTEATANYYYKFLKQYLSTMPYTSDYADVVDVYIDLLEIIIDEKAIADLMPGNYMFVLHDMKTKTVNYTDYIYDDNFKSTEVKKTKQELSPNFTFVMETKKEGFMEKLAHLPLKYAEKEKYNYKDKGGYYELAFEEGKYPISSIYFMVKNGKLIITTSKASIDMTIAGTGYPLDADTKNSILNNNYSLKINSKKLLQQISPELTTGLNKKISSYLQENMGDVKMESSMKDGMMQGTTTMNITGTHTNSLEFFFNLIDGINDIIEKDKADAEKKVD